MGMEGVEPVESRNLTTTNRNLPSLVTNRGRPFLQEVGGAICRGLCSRLLDERASRNTGSVGLEHVLE